MKLELSEIFGEVLSYLLSAWVTVNPVLKWLISGVAWVLFPTSTGVFLLYAKILCIAIVVDLITKYYAIASNNGGLWNALKTGKISSNRMWLGTRRKIVSYLVIMIFVGLGYRFEILQGVVEFLGTLAYAVMFLREGQSVAENLMEAGHKDVKWFAMILKRKEEELLEQNGASLVDVEKKEELINGKE